jgi:hypothetical protein
MNPKPFLFVAVLFVGLTAVSAFAQGDDLISVTSTQGLLRRVNPLTGTTLQFAQMVTTTNVNVQGCTGLTRNPVNGVLYAIMRDVGAPTVRKLATINPQTAVATIIGPVGDNFAGVACRSDGTLFAVTGDGAVVPETLWTLDVNTAVATIVMPLGNGGPGETIAFGADGLLYHCSGYGGLNSDQILEAIDTFALTVTPVILSGYDSNEVLSVTEWVGGNLLMVDLNDQSMVVTTGGVVSHLGQFDHAAVKGLSFLPSPSTQPFFRAYGQGCTAASGLIPLLAYTGTPTFGQNVQLNLILAAPNTALALGIGYSNSTAPIPSPSCQVQILPIDPNILFFTTTATGTWTLPVTVPTIPPQDFFVQVAIADPAGLVLSNPVQIHVQ